MSRPAPEHPNRPARGVLVLAFAAIFVAGLLGGAIGYGIVNASCTETPTVADQLTSTVPGVHTTSHSCDAALVGGALIGTVIAGMGAGIVAGLMLRAQSEWRAHPPGTAMSGAARRPVNRSGSSGNPPHR